MPNLVTLLSIEFCQLSKNESLTILKFDLKFELNAARR